MKKTKRIAAMAVCAVMMGSIATGNSSVYFNNLIDFSANAALISDLKLNTTTTGTLDCRVVQLKTTYADNSKFYSTGFIIGDNTIASCAHGLYKPDKGGYPTKVSVFLKRCGNDYEKGFSISYSKDKKNIIVPDNYIKNSSSNYDMGIIYTNTDLSGYGKFELNTKYTAYESHMYKLTGYPHTSNTEYNNVQCYSNGKGTSTTSSSKLYYTATSIGGMSGGPVTYNDKVVAVNHGGDSTVSYGTRGISWFEDKIK